MKISNLLSFAVLAIYVNLNNAQTVKDFDGNVYNTVTIGTQVWIKENLNVKHYRNGDAITEIQDSIAWVNRTSGARCYFDNKPANGDVFGSLYNWFAVADLRGIAPVGWHVPGDAEWKMLEIYLGMTPSAANKSDYRGTDQGSSLKEAGLIHWWWDKPPYNTGTNSSGFTAYGNGYRIFKNYVGYPSFTNLTNSGQWWSATATDDSTAWLRHLCVYHEDVYRSNWLKTNGCAIRCVRDAPAGFNELEEDIEINVYPNPCSDRISIDIPNYQNYTIQIFTMVGECILQEPLKKDSKEFVISSLPKGIYTLKLTSPFKAVEKKLIKQ